MKKHIALILVTILSSFQLDAQSPQGFNYQVTVRNSAGELLMNQNANFQFSIVQGSPSGTSMYVETHTVQTDDLAQVALVIGQGNTVSGDFSQIDWSLGSYYLAIELGTGSGYVSMGTTQFLSIPYALYADTAGNVEVLQTQIDELVLLTDADNDGFSENQGDCDDTNDTVYPGATENETDGIDNDCDGEVDETLGYEATFYHFHMGGSVAPYGDLIPTNTAWYDSSGSLIPNTSSGFNTIMTDMIDNGDGTMQSSGVTMPTTEQFEFAGPIDGQQGCNPQWTHTVTGGNDFYYIAVPNNSAFNVNLVTAGFLQFNCAGTYNASERRAFVYNGENYWLYKLQNASGTNAMMFGFK